jgi:hypothetical protein
MITGGGMQYKKVSVNVDAEKWEKFKKLAKYKNSDTNKEIRKFIDRYLSDNAQLFLELESKRSNK